MRDYQTQIDVGTLYEVRATGRGTEQILPTVEIIGGTVDVYASQTEPATAPAGMKVFDNGLGVVGTLGFAYLPAYIYFFQASGTTTSIILSGIEAVEVV